MRTATTEEMTRRPDSKERWLRGARPAALTAQVLLILSAAIVALLPEPYQRIELHDLFNIAVRQHEIPWERFNDSVDIHRLYGDGKIGPSAALIRFRKAGQVPVHYHSGYEHILVLHGTQRDQNGPAEAGTLMINSPGNSHSVTSDAGCIVLAIYEKPVRFDQSAGTTPPSASQL
jgi:quercetin dioxygenase-like cupin family protein